MSAYVSSVRLELVRVLGQLAHELGVDEKLLASGLVLVDDAVMVSVLRHTYPIRSG
jgi:hypothetical protein